MRIFYDKDLRAWNTFSRFTKIVIVTFIIGGLFSVGWTIYDYFREKSKYLEWEQAKPPNAEDYRYELQTSGSSVPVKIDVMCRPTSDPLVVTCKTPLPDWVNGRNMRIRPYVVVDGKPVYGDYSQWMIGSYTP